MFSEILLIILISQITSQSSALWMSLMLVPSTAFLMLGWADISSFSGVMVVLVILVFIGGLLVLLVSISSAISQEHGMTSVSFFFVIPLFAIFLIFETKEYSVATSMFFFSWMSWGLPSLFFFCVILTFSLLLMTWLSISFKGSLRGIYNYFI